ncbi:hypothetical protein PM082_018382 [Marasmius tenuissimus]|nr:hypothetical protein PM082_018382 [Marasmius tenuissimus]
MTSSVSNHALVTSSTSKYAQVIGREPSVSDKRGEVYVLEGTNIITGSRFWKVGRSCNPQRRLSEHIRKCKSIKWDFLGSWTMEHSHKAETLIHYKMGMSDFLPFDEACSCGIDHRERFVHAHLGMEDALEEIEITIVDHSRA